MAVTKTLVKDLYERLLFTHRRTGKIQFNINEISQMIGVRGINAKEVVEGLLEANAITRIGQVNYRLTHRLDEQKLVQAKIAKLKDTVQYSFEKFGLKESVLNLNEDPMDIEAMDSEVGLGDAGMDFDAEVTKGDLEADAINTGAYDSYAEQGTVENLMDELTITMNYTCNTVEEAVAFIDQLKIYLVNSGVDSEITVKLNEYSPISITLSGKPECISRAEFNLAGALDVILGDNVDISTLNVKKERTSAYVA